MLVAACGPVDHEATVASSPFAQDTAISGVVLENVTACEVDAACYLRIAFADTTVVALYGTGERPAPACRMSAEVSNTAFLVQPREVVKVVISRCDAERYYIRGLVRAAD